MSATEYRLYHLVCDGPGRDQRYRGDNTLSRAALRKRAAKAGWLHEHRDGYPRQYDKDYCPRHHEPDTSA